MSEHKTKSLRGIEERMKDLDQDSLRYHVLDSAKQFKSSWIDLGRALYTVWKEKAYKGWGYSTFDIYTAKELGIRKDTAVKLLKSYYFLEQEEPRYLHKEEPSSPLGVAGLPSYESVNVLRLAKNKKNLDEEDYEHLKKKVFEEGQDAREVKKDVTALIRQRREVDPEEAWRQRRSSLVKRLLGTLKTIKQEAAVNKILPAKLVNETEQLIMKLERELS